MGSVKDVVIQEKPEGEKLGTGTFVFSDRYSVFDYGEMPDLIEGKGASLCLISAYFFEKMEDKGIKNHYRGVVEGNRLKRIDEVEEPSNVMQTKLVRVLEPSRVNGYDYSIFKREKGNLLIPLEVIYRNVLPPGSSVFKRLDRGEITPEQLGLDEYPAPGSVLSKPVLDVSTKLESVDRYMSWDEAEEISGLSEDELEELKEVAHQVNKLISDETGKAGIRNEDGKFEFAFDNERNLLVVDSVGTPDECRFSYWGMQISKEILRIYYRNTEWYNRLEGLKGQKDWKTKAGDPPKLPADWKNTVSDMYKACCNEVTGLKFFDVDDLGKVVKHIKSLVEDYGGY
ncbi:MAG: phosphoribosylaminoimidazolesuccinocarboxamide synthase [Archaeoglobaceae archaeon]